MATEKKLKDPAEAALSAIEQALNLEVLTPEAESRAEPRLPDVGDVDPLQEPAGRLSPPSLDLDPPLASDVPPPGRERAHREGGLLPPDRSLVANDDRRNIGILQQTLRVRPARTPYILAAIAAFLWVERPRPAGLEPVRRRPQGLSDRPHRASGDGGRGSARRAGGAVPDHGHAGGSRAGDAPRCPRRR